MIVGYQGCCVTEQVAYCSRTPSGGVVRMNPAHVSFVQLRAMAVSIQMRLLFLNGTKVTSSCLEGGPYYNSPKDGTG